MFEEFNAVSKKEWQEKVMKDLKGRPFEELQWHLGQDLLIDPFYHSDDNIEQNLINQRNSSDWEIGEKINIQNLSSANKQLLDALKNGVNSPSLAFSSIPQIQDFKIILKNVIPAYIKLNFHFEGDVQSCKEFLNNYHSYLQSQQVEPESLEGGFYFNLQEAEDQSKLLLHSKSLFPKYRCLNITATKDNDHPNISSYLGELIKSIDQTFQLIEEADISNIQITVQIGKSYFVEIAKIRAIRILWKHLCNAYQVSERIAYINAIFEEEAYDEDTNTNMIRSMTMAMSAVIGGVNRLTIRPADQSDSTMTNRIARNVQHLLKMESYMDRVIDPAAGSYYIEKLTNLFVEQAWEVFTSK